jgi:tellurium resistance protein TerZ
MAISLVKGQKISLKKESGAAITQFCAGANWGAHASGRSIDLDLHAALFTEDKQLIEHVYFARLASATNAVYLSGDDTKGDVGGDDGQDNETLTFHLDRLPANCAKVAVFLCSFSKDDFAAVPHADVRIYEGMPGVVHNVVASYRVSTEPNFAGSIVMVMGMFYKHNGEWKFNALGTPTKDSSYTAAIATIRTTML